VEGLGNLARRRLTAGRAADESEAEPLLAGITARFVAAYKAYDCDAWIATITAVGAEAVIPPRTNRTEQRHFDRHLDKGLNLIKRFVCPNQTLSQDLHAIRHAGPALRGVHRHHCRLDLARPMSNLPWEKGQHHGIPG
jgi:hypothetical protein